MVELRECKCCGADVEPYDICDACGWQDDGVQNSGSGWIKSGNRSRLKNNRIYSTYDRDKGIMYIFENPEKSFTR